MMKQNDNKLDRKMIIVRLMVFGLILIWTTFLSLFFYYNYQGMKQWTIKLAETEAWASFNKDVIYRKWAASHGGVYVPPTEKTPPSPYLKHIPDRDIVSTEGKKLTLINPAYMTRQVHELGKEQYRAQGHITSLQPIRPGNEPDPWEEKTLKLFLKGVTEESELIKNQNGKSVLRAMKPLRVNKGCLKCHQYQGYKIGDIRGGLSVEVPMEPYNNILKNHVIKEAVVFVTIWFLGVLAIIIVAIFYVKNLQITINNLKKQRAMELQLQQSQKMEAVGQLAGGIAHDFNNLLGIIIGFSELIQDEINESNPILKYSDNVIKTAERAKDLVRQISIFSRQKDIERDVFDVNSLVREFLKLLRRTLGEHIDVQFKKGADPLKTLGDRTQLEQVIMNLCVNARDAMPKGGKLLLETDHKSIDKDFCLSHPWAKPGDYVIIKVSDTGMGIDSESLSRIFDPFFTTKEIGKGTGLGLSVVFGIVQKHDGFINVYSVPNHGTIFSIFLPVANKNIIDIKKKKLIDEKETTLCEGTILVAEDEELLRDMISNILKSAGYNIILAENGEVAVDLFNKKSEEIDLLLFDVMMPVMGGLKAYQKISHIKKNVPILFASGYSSEAISSELFNVGDYKMIWKPFSRDELLKKIDDLINSSRYGESDNAI